MRLRIYGLDFKDFRACGQFSLVKARKARPPLREGLGRDFGFFGHFLPRGSHIHYHYGIRSPKPKQGWFFGGLIP